MITRKITLYIFLISICISSLSNASVEPLTTDNRIKTYFYNENDIFKLVVHSGYQSSIEFANDEKVNTISLGDNFSWKVTPVGKRLFIKPMQNNLHTNLTVITNKRTYYFDLFAKAKTEDIDKDLVYVMKFFYPKQNSKN